MLEAGFWDSPGWVVATAILAAIGVVVAVFVYRRGRTTKALSYEISNTELVSVRSGASDKIAITYDGSTVTGVYLVTVKFRNDGNVPIVESEFDNPLQILLGDAATALSASVEDPEPEDLAPSVRTSEHAVLVEPTLLNPGDRFTVSALASDFEGPVKLVCRIAGISRLTDEAQRVSRRTQVAGWVAAPLAAVVFFGGMGALTWFAADHFIGVHYPDDTNYTYFVRSGKRIQQVCASEFGSNRKTITLSMKAGDIVTVERKNAFNTHERC